MRRNLVKVELETEKKYILQSLNGLDVPNNSLIFKSSGNEDGGDVWAFPIS